MVGKRRPQTSVPRRVNTITAHESCTINHEPRSARGDGAARVTKWRAVPLGSTTRPNAVQSFSLPCRVVTNRASRMQSQIYLNFAEAMPIDGRAQVAPLQLCTIPVYKFCFSPISRISHLSRLSHLSRTSLPSHLMTPPTIYSPSMCLLSSKLSI